jgi:hypothetical protein
MKGRSKASAAIVVAVAIGIMSSLAVGVTAAMAAPAPDPLFQLQVAALEREGMSPAQAQRGIEFQRAVDEADLTERLEARLGDAFGGLWFQPSAAELHVGAVSPASRRAAEALAERTGFGDGVVVTPVRSSWNELRAAQAVWNEKLSGPLARGEVVTALDPRSNAVEVRLGSAISSARREALEREDPLGGASAEFVSMGHSGFGLAETNNRCREFAEDNAFCDPTPVAGVTISTTNRICTAGPAVIQQKFTTNTTETFLLTAGHCTKTQETWSSSDKNKNPIEIGKSLIGMTRQAGEKVDIGVIKIENAKWQNAGQIPVNPAVAYWVVGAPHEPIAVGKQQEPAVNRVTCLSGQTTGTACGKTKATGVNIEEHPELVEVARTPLSKEGDSGGPYFTVGELGAEVEGTLVGNVEEGGKLVADVFTPLKYSFERLETKGYNLKLLTPASEKRPNCPMPGMEGCFLAEGYSATLTGSQVGSNVFTFKAGTVKCSSISYSGTLEEQSTTIELAPSYSECTAFGFVNTTIDVNGCKYKATVTSKVAADSFSGTVDVVCPETKKIAITAFNCEVTFGSQTGWSTSFTDTTAASPKKDVDISVSATGTSYTQTSKSFPGCTNGSFTDGKYSGETTVKADAAGSATGIEVG